MSVTWETCSLRTWLNGTFLNEAFSKDEQEAILVTDVDNSDSQGIGKWLYDVFTKGGNDTRDKVFLLSCKEAERYFDSDKSRVCVPTTYARAQGASAAGNGSWWLRSPGSRQSSASFVGRTGELSFTRVEYKEEIRPALWINLESDIF